MYELLKRPKIAKGCLGGVGQKQLLGGFFFKVQSLWSKVQHICLFSKECPKSLGALLSFSSISGPYIQVNSTLGSYAIT